MAFKLAEKEFCRACDKKTSHAFICNVQKFLVKQCVICQSVRTFKKSTGAE
jgi:hypothetical protein